MKNVLILIPARFNSGRFPGKPLALIDGKSMIQRVLENCLQTTHADFNFSSFVVTDDARIETHVKTFSPNNVVRIDDDVISGTLRIELAYERFFKQQNFDLIINVQGDEPLLTGFDLAGLASFHVASEFDIATMVKKQMNFDLVFSDPNKVKVAMSEATARVFYFSRAPIPFKREVKISPEHDYWFLHIGVYSFRPIALTKFSKASESRLEFLEKLEQLRALEIGLSIGAFKISSTVIGVDHPEDITKVEEVLRGRK